MNKPLKNELPTILHGLTREGVEYLELTRKSPPSRPVGRNSLGSLVVNYPSRKMGFAIACESSLERYAAIEFELSESITEFYPQPPLCHVAKPNKLGRIQISPYTPDFLVLDNGVVYVVEIKSSQAASKLVNERPWEWCIQGNEFVNRPIRDYFSKLGITHIVYVPDHIGKIRLANLTVLDAAMKVPWELTDADLNTIFNRLKSKPFVTIKEASDLVGKNDVTGILQLIACKIVYCDIDKQLLEHPESAYIFLDSTIPNSSAKAIDYSDKAGILADISTEELKKSLKSLERVNNLNRSQKTRSDYRLLRKLKEGRKRGLPDIISLAPKQKQRGNRCPKISNSVYEFSKEYIEKHRPTSSGQRSHSLYYKYKIAALDFHPELKPISKVTFYRYLKTLNPVKVALAHKGRRAANAEKPARAINDRYIKPSIPFMEATIDHYHTDIFIEILGHGDCRITKRLYLSAMRDIASGAILAYYLSIKPPSRSNTAVLLRRCVKNWGCLPLSIRVDRGSDFKSVYIDAIFAHLGITKVLSPASDPRFGSEIERFFLEVKNNWLAGRPGFIEGIQDRRGTSKELGPEALACLSPLDLIKEIEDFVNLRNERPHGNRSRTPKSMIEEAKTKFRFSRIPVNLDENFLADTAVDLRKLTICRIRGIKVNERYYWNPEMKSRSKSTVDVRLDPENPFRLYFYLKKRWQVAIASGYQHFEALATDTQKMAESLWLIQGGSIRRSLIDDAHMKIAAAQRTYDESQLENSHPEYVPDDNNAGPASFDPDVSDFDLGNW